MYREFQVLKQRKNPVTKSLSVVVRGILTGDLPKQLEGWENQYVRIKIEDLSEVSIEEMPLGHIKGHMVVTDFESDQYRREGYIKISEHDWKNLNSYKFLEKVQIDF